MTRILWSLWLLLALGVLVGGCSSGTTDYIPTKMEPPPKDPPKRLGQ